MKDPSPAVAELRMTDRELFNMNLPDVKENILLADYATFKIGGPARYFFIAKNQEEVISALKWAQENKLLIFILAGGSNILFSDKGFDGLVIKILNTQYIIHNTSIIADAGVSLSKLVIESANTGLTGLEWAMGIPGTIGGAICGNAGAYGHSISESVEKVKTLSLENGASLRGSASWRRRSNPMTIFTGSPRSVYPELVEGLAMTERKYDNKNCEFGYRESIFKKNKEIILEVVLKLKKGDKDESQKQIKDIILERKKKTPPYPSAGSFFKNYVLQGKEDSLIKNFPDLAGRVKAGKLGVGYLIDQCGLKGEKHGQAMVSYEHGNFIVNLGGATAKDVLGLAELCKQKVFEKYGIKLNEETRLVGFD